MYLLIEMLLKATKISLYDFYCLIIKYLYSMERKYITINGLKKVLSPREMKNITGGSLSCLCDCDGRQWYAACPPNTTATECEGMQCPGINCFGPFC